jgi:hypothetical protein
MHITLTPQNTVHCGRFEGQEQVCIDCGEGMRSRIHSDLYKTWPEIQATETETVPNPYEGL